VSPDKVLYGLLAEFSDHEELLKAVRNVRAAGYRRIDAYSPFPVEGLAEAVGQPRNAVALCCLIGGILGGSGGYFMQDYAMSTSYALNIGGRPLHNIPPYIPITFELTILCAALFTAIGMLALNRLPRPHHPVFGAKGFERATSDRFFLSVEASDPAFERLEVERLLEAQHPIRVTEVYE